MTAFIMRGLLAACLSLSVAGAPKVFGDEQSTSPYATAADFAKYAMKLREQALVKVEPQVLIPTSSHPAVQRYPWKMSIVTTVFWVGEQASGNNPVPNYKSSWDYNWTTDYGGTDDPNARRNSLGASIPVAFTPKQNPNHGAGLDVSPAVRDYLGLAPTDVTDWQFVEVRDVPPGPWRNYGDNNHFVLARRQSDQQLAAGGSGAAKK